MSLRRCISAFVLLFAASVLYSQDNSVPYKELRWRCIGPFRAGRTVAIAGIPDQPNVFFMAPNNGGVWKTDDFGRTWAPIFDGQPTGSVGALALAPSDPNIIYVGSGEGLRRPDLSTGDGIYKSTDGGKTWTHLGLRNGQQIGSILIDPRDPNRVYVAVLGHPYGPNSERGVFRSTDGGQTFQKILYKDENTGAIDLAFDPSNPQTIYADMWASRRGPWTAGDSYNAAGSGLYKSTDGGDHWTQLTGGLPDWEHDKLGRIGIGIAPSNPRRMYAMVDSPTKGGVYRSDDAGETWKLVNNEERVWGRGSDFAWVRVSPRDENTIYVANTSSYKSTDGGQTFTAWKGAPGGDDYHSIWINPKNPDIIFLGVDQGASITVNGGRTWSSWYNQPTGQLYHLAADDRFPYWVYAGQQDSGTVAIASRSDYGQITWRDWHPVGGDERDYDIPDPVDPNIVYGSGLGGRVSRWDARTGEVTDVSPWPLGSYGARPTTVEHHFNWVTPLVASRSGPPALYLGGEVLFKTTDQGNHWSMISPDLTGKRPGATNCGGDVSLEAALPCGYGTIISIEPSPNNPAEVWTGSDTGIVSITRDGGAHWSQTTLPGIRPWSKVASIDLSTLDPQTAYVAVDGHRLDDWRPHIFRT